MKPLVIVAALCVGLVVGYAAAVNVWDDKARTWQKDADSLIAEVKVWKAETARLLTIATKPDTVRLPARRPVRTVQVETLGFDSTAHNQSLALIDTLLSEQSQLHDRIGRDSVKLQAFTRLVARDTVLIDSLTNLVKRAPVGRKRGISILGLRLCPQWGVGYGLSADGRHGPVLAVVQPLSCG